MTHLFVINPISFLNKGAMRAIMAEIETCFAGKDAGNCFVHVSRYPRDAMVIIRKYLADIPETQTVRVYAVGGDGILFDCLNGIAGIPNAELASVPYGNGNDFVRAFGENKNSLFRDIQLQTNSPSIPVDIIHCGTRYALNFCTVGLESDAIMTSIALYNSVAGKIRKFRRLNFLAYTLLFYMGGVKAVLNRRILNQRYEITVDGEDMSGVYGAVNIANGPCYGGDKNPVMTAMPNDGVLDALFFRCGSSLRAMTLIGAYVRGGCLQLPKKYFTWKRLRKIDIRSDEPLLVDLDGETFFDTAITVEIIPAGIRFVSPGGMRFCKRMDADEHNG
ncbi:MAG: diacylglycerol kinase family lipid kinase [Treponemataceae bacterium]|nr:MAG: diacylglycerol kinase family lipid kinase [Treponemataceae bacterium]